MADRFGAGGRRGKRDMVALLIALSLLVIGTGLLVGVYVAYLIAVVLA